MMNLRTIFGRMGTLAGDTEVRYNTYDPPSCRPLLPEISTLNWTQDLQEYRR